MLSSFHRKGHHDVTCDMLTTHVRLTWWELSIQTVPRRRWINITKPIQRRNKCTNLKWDYITMKGIIKQLIFPLIFYSHYIHSFFHSFQFDIDRKLCYPQLLLLAIHNIIKTQTVIKDELVLWLLAASFIESCFNQSVSFLFCWCCCSCRQLWWPAMLFASLYS